MGYRFQRKARTITASCNSHTFTATPCRCPSMKSSERTRGEGVPYSSANPFMGTRDVPVTNCSRRIRFSASISSTVWHEITETHFIRVHECGYISSGGKRVSVCVCECVCVCVCVCVNDRQELSALDKSATVYKCIYLSLIKVCTALPCPVM